MVAVNTWLAIGAIAIWVCQEPALARSACLTQKELKPGQRVAVIAGGDVPTLLRALRMASAGTILSLRDGTYRLRSNQSLEVNVTGITILSASGNRDAVVIEGGYNNVSVNADDFTLADVTLKRPRFHNVQVRGERGVARTTIYNVHLVDAGQQFVKVSAGNGKAGQFADEGRIACSSFEYTTHAPTPYTNGVDILAGKGWVVEDNVFRRIRSKKGPAGPTILAWRNAQGTVVRRNIIVDSWRGIALGLSAPNRLSRGGSSVQYDHGDGLVENNVVLALTEPADAAIENSYALNSRVLYNTVFYAPGLKHAVSWAIEYRFSPTTAVIKNNLTNLPILKRRPFPRTDAVLAGNVSTARVEWFRDVLRGDFHLTRKARGAIDSGVLVREVQTDIDGNVRPFGRTADVGADEFMPANH